MPDGGRRTQSTASDSSHRVGWLRALSGKRPPTDVGGLWSVPVVPAVVGVVDRGVVPAVGGLVDAPELQHIQHAVVTVPGVLAVLPPALPAGGRREEGPVFDAVVAEPGFHLVGLQLPGTADGIAEVATGILRHSSFTPMIAYLIVNNAAIQ